MRSRRKTTYFLIFLPLFYFVNPFSCPNLVFFFFVSLILFLLFPFSPFSQSEEAIFEFSPHTSQKFKWYENLLTFKILFLLFPSFSFNHFRLLSPILSSCLSLLRHPSFLLFLFLVPHSNKPFHSLALQPRQSSTGLLPALFSLILCSYFSSKTHHCNATFSTINLPCRIALFVSDDPHIPPSACPLSQSVYVPSMSFWHSFTNVDILLIIPLCHTPLCFDIQTWRVVRLRFW